jgi:hypothetical protein
MPTISSTNDVRRLVAERDLRDPTRRPEPVVLRLAGFPDDEARAVEREVNALLGECGCTTGKIWLTVAAIALLVVAAPGVPYVPFTGVAQAAVCATWLLGAAAAGKVLGVTRARSRAVTALYAAAGRSDLALMAA